MERALVLLLLLFQHVVATLQQREEKALGDFVRQREECLKELHLRASDFHFTEADFIDNERQHNSADAKCLLRCFLKKWGFLNATDALQIDVVKSKMHFYDEESVDLGRCAKIKSENKCDAALLVRRCIWAELGKQRDHAKYLRTAKMCLFDLDLDYTLSEAMNLVTSLANDSTMVDDDADVRCFMACMLRKFGYFDDSGALRISYTLADVEEMKKADIDKCAQMKTNDVCVQILTVRQCLVEEMDKRNKSSV